MDSFPITATPNGITEEECFHRHCRALRKQFPKSTFIFIIESNLAFTIARRFGHWAKRYAPSASMSIDVKQNDNPRVGITMSSTSKVVCKRHVEDLLKNDLLYVCNQLVCTSQSANDILKLLKEQLCFYRAVVKRSRDPVFTQSRWKLTGKGTGQQDDLAMAIMFTTYYAHVWVTDDERAHRPQHTRLKLIE